MTTQPSQFEQMKDAMRAPWKLGDFGALSRTLGNHEAQDFVNRLKLEPGAQVLDIACGTGAATLPLARRGVSVTGLDMTPRLLEEARASAAGEGLRIHFDEGFVEELPYPDASFNVVVSMFGAIFSPRPEVVVSEIARVLKPGGLLAMANWTQSGFSGRMSSLPGAYFPPRPGAISPMLWGENATACERLAHDFASVETCVVAFKWELGMNAAKAAAFFTENAGPLQLLLSRLEEQDHAALLQDLQSFWIEENLSSEQNYTVVHNEYLEVLATRR